jgi:hypothetical protein
MNYNSLISIIFLSPDNPGNETPRQGIGNQNQGHPAAHGAFNSQFEEEDAENVAENC